jgi:hypothetical protein
VSEAPSKDPGGDDEGSGGGGDHLNGLLVSEVYSRITNKNVGQSNEEENLGMFGAKLLIK